MSQSKYGMLTIFNFGYNAVETVLTMRQLSRRFLQISRDPYVQENFKICHYGGVNVDVRQKNDV